MFEILNIATDIFDAVIASLRTVGGYFMALIYTAIRYFYEVFEYLARAQIINNDFVKGIYQRIGLVLGLFMTFKLVFSLIQALLDPSKLTDKNKGATAILKRTIISIILLGTVPYIFSEAYTIQNLIVGGNGSDNVLYKIIAQKPISDMESTGVVISSDLYFDFFKDDEAPKLNEGVEDFVSTCNNTQGYCDRFKQKDYENLKQYVRDDQISLFETIDYLSLKDESTGEYIIEFNYGLIGIIAGGFILYMVFMYCIQTAIRIAQLAYLQVIAPIPILSYISDPEGIFKKWVKQCTSTYLDLFLRLTVIYFSMTLVSMVIDEFNNPSGIVRSSMGLMSSTVQADSVGGFTLILVKFFIIIGLLLFAKKAPELIKDLFPTLEGTGKFSFGLGKKTLQETGKSIWNSPIGWGIKLGGKGLTAIDRKRYGLPKPRTKFQQELDKIMPGRAEYIKNKNQGIVDAKERNELYTEGAGIYKKYNGDLKDDQGKLKQGVFKHNEFKKTWQKVADAKKEKQKYADDFAQVQQMVTTGRISTDSEIYKTASKQLRAAESRLESAKKDHDNSRKVYTDDARQEDAFNYYKDMQESDPEKARVVDKELEEYNKEQEAKKKEAEERVKEEERKKKEAEAAALAEAERKRKEAEAAALAEAERKRKEAEAAAEAEAEAAIDALAALSEEKAEADRLFSEVGIDKMSDEQQEMAFDVYEKIRKAEERRDKAIGRMAETLNNPDTSDDEKIRAAEILEKLKKDNK